MPLLDMKNIRLSFGGPLLLDGTDLVIEPGERICFRSFLKDVYHDFEPDEDGCRIFILKAADIMMSIDKSVDVGIFS